MLNHRNLLPLLGLLLATPELHAQPGDPEGWSPERRREIQAQQSAYLTRRMALTPEEAQRFWPVYNQFDEALHELRRGHRDKMQAQEGSPNEAEAKALLDARLDMRDQENALRRKYDAEFRKSIGAVKTWELYQAERDFHREMLRSMRKGDGDRQRHGPKPDGRPGPGR